jgi:hypothetical protein
MLLLRLLLPWLLLLLHLLSRHTSGICSTLLLRSCCRCLCAL